MATTAFLRSTANVPMTLIKELARLPQWLPWWRPERRQLLPWRRPSQPVAPFPSPLMHLPHSWNTRKCLLDASILVVLKSAIIDSFSGVVYSLVLARISSITQSTLLVTERMPQPELITGSFVIRGVLTRVWTATGSWSRGSTCAVLNFQDKYRGPPCKNRFCWN